MANPIEENASKILISLFENNPEGNLQFDGKDIEQFTGLSPREINLAIDYLDERDLLDRLNYMGTHPFNFGHVYLNSRGVFLYHEMNASQQSKEGNDSIKSEILSKQPVAAGSPFGFTDLDWGVRAKRT